MWCGLRAVLGVDVISLAVELGIVAKLIAGEGRDLEALERAQEIVERGIIIGFLGVAIRKHLAIRAEANTVDQGAIAAGRKVDADQLLQIRRADRKSTRLNSSH